MVTQEIAQELHSRLKPFITEDNEELFFKHLISEFCLREVDPEIYEEVMRELYKLLIEPSPYAKNWQWADYESYIDSLVYEEEQPNTGLDGLSLILTQTYPKSEALHLINEVKRILRPYQSKEIYECKVSSERYIVMNKPKKIIQSKYLKTKKDGTPSKVLIETIINAYPQEVIIHDSPITDMGRTFTFKWTSKTSGRLFETRQATISEIENYLQEAGWVMNPKYLRGSLAAVIDTAITNNLAKIMTDIDNPGFYYDSKEEKLIKISLELPEYDDEKLTKALGTLQDLAKHTSINKAKLASVIKWGLIAPFSYAKKQYGASWIPWLYLHGKAKSGKTTIGLIILYLWSKPDQTNNIGGSGFDTPARVGEKLGISTLPLLVNEPEGALSKPSVMGLIKSAIESPVARGKFKGGKYQNLPSFAPVIMTANMYLPQEDAILRRMYSIDFTHSEKRDDNEAKKFEEFFSLNNPNNSVLLNLHYLSSFVFNELSEDTSLLKLDWQELADTIVGRLYHSLGLKVPSWLKLWYESTSLEDLDDDEIESIRMFLVDEINRHSKQIKKYTESGYLAQEETYTLDDAVSDGSEFKERVCDVLNHHLIPWMGIRDTKYGEKQVYFTAGAKKFIGNVTTTSKSMNSISQLLGWEYNMISGMRGKYMKIYLDDFVDFLLNKE